MLAPHAAIQSATQVTMMRPIEGSEQFYDPDGDELRFLKEATGTSDEEDLKARIIEVQREAYKVARRDVLPDCYAECIACCVSRTDG